MRAAFRHLSTIHQNRAPAMILKTLLAKFVGPFVLLSLVTALSAAGHAAAQSDNPDFTEGGTIPEGAVHDWALGATGARGWMYSDRLVTTDARQISITEVAEGSPADGVLAIGDTLLGVNGEQFSHDPRTELGKALTTAETKKGRGKLSLIRWRKGKTKKVTVKLPSTVALNSSLAWTRIL